MTDLEKKAIEWLKKADWFSARLYSPTILNLIEKQQKEIEELKNALDLKCNKLQCKNMPDNIEMILMYKNDFDRNFGNDFVSKDKIKAKIEEVKDGTYDAKIVLQSLLPKE